MERTEDSTQINQTFEKKGTWMTFRPDIKVVDCTIRDGGLVNNFKFEDSFVKEVYQTLIAAGVDYMELGYKASRRLFSTNNFGLWKFCDEEDIRRVIGDFNPAIKLSVMADAERTDYHEDMSAKSQSIFDMVRVATYVHQIPAAVDMIKDAHDKGYETTINLMAISLVKESELEEALNILASTEVDVIYVVDSFGTLYSETTRELVKKYLSYAQKSGKKVGIHAHNNQQLAYANTQEALILGASYLDATIYGLGRGAGNCPMELLLGFLKNPKFKQRPILKIIEKEFFPLKKKITWGYDIPFMLTGQLNRHPSSAIKFIDAGNTDYVGFNDALIEED